MKRRPFLCLRWETRKVRGFVCAVYQRRKSVYRSRSRSNNQFGRWVYIYPLLYRLWHKITWPLTVYCGVKILFVGWANQKFFRYYPIWVQWSSFSDWMNNFEITWPNASHPITWWIESRDRILTCDFYFSNLTFCCATLNCRTLWYCGLRHS